MMDGSRIVLSEKNNNCERHHLITFSELSVRLASRLICGLLLRHMAVKSSCPCKSPGTRHPKSFIHGLRCYNATHTLIFGLHYYDVTANFSDISGIFVSPIPVKFVELLENMPGYFSSHIGMVALVLRHQIHARSISKVI